MFEISKLRYTRGSNYYDQSRTLIARLLIVLNCIVDKMKKEESDLPEQSVPLHPSLQAQVQVRLFRVPPFRQTRGHSE